MPVPSLFRVFDAYASATGLSESTVSRHVLGRGGRIGDLRRGGDIGVRTIQRALAWFSLNWPADVAWPDGVPRPASAADAVSIDVGTEG